MTTRSAAAPGTRITFDVSGEGPDLFFLHAGIADRTMWAPQVEAFVDRYRITTPDARGFGDTPIGNEPFSRRDDLGVVMDISDQIYVLDFGQLIGEGRPEEVAANSKVIEAYIGEE